MNSDTIFILYVSDQQKSKEFYEKVFDEKPILDVTGMTEFKVNPSTKLGLMPENGIAKILGNKVPHPAKGNGIPRCEIYLYVENPDQYSKRALGAGATEICPLQKRNWGDEAAYYADADGHILVFAKRVSE